MPCTHCHQNGHYKPTCAQYIASHATNIAIPNPMVFARESRFQLGIADRLVSVCADLVDNPSGARNHALAYESDTCCLQCMAVSFMWPELVGGEYSENRAMIARGFADNTERLLVTGWNNNARERLSQLRAHHEEFLRTTVW